MKTDNLINLIPKSKDVKVDKYLIKELKLLRREIITLNLFFLKGKYTSTTVKEFKELETLLLKRLKEFK